MNNISSLDEYHSNLARIEKARRVLDNFQTMNEEAKNKLEYEQELARKVAEGDRARQELDMIRHRNELALTVPPAPSISHAAPPVYAQTTARIEEVPTHGYGYAEQRNAQISFVQPQWQVQRQEPTHQQSFYTRDPVFRAYQHPEQQNGNQQMYQTNQPTAQYQPEPVWSTYARQISSQQYQHRQPQLPTQVPTPNIRSAVPEARPQTQRMTAPRQGHSQQGAPTPVSIPVAFSNPQPSNVTRTLSAFANSSSSVAAPAPMSSSRPETQKVPYSHETISIRPAAPEPRPQTQRMTEPHRDHSQQGVITPVPNTVTFSKSRQGNPSSTSSTFGNSSSSVAALEPAPSTTPETQKVSSALETNNIRPALQESRPQAQQRTKSQQDHPQQGTITSVSKPTTFSKPQLSNTDSALSSFYNTSSSVAVVEPVSSSSLEPQKSDINNTSSLKQPQTTAVLYKPTSDVHLHGLGTNLDLIRYLTASYPSWVNNMPLNSYYPISSTQYYVWKNPDNVLLLVYPTGTGEYQFVDMKRFSPQHTPASLSSQRENTHPTTPNQTVSLPNLAQAKNLQPAQAAATIPAQPSGTAASTQPTTTHQIIPLSPSTPQTENLQRTQMTTTPVLTVKSNLPMQPQQRSAHPNKEHAQASPKRAPAEADKKSLARDIIRALSLKRHRPPESPATQLVERPAKRHEQEPSAHLLNRTPGGVPNDFGNPSPVPTRLPAPPPPPPTTNTEVSVVGSPTSELPSVRIAEPPTESEPGQTVEEVVSSTVEEVSAPSAVQSINMDVDETTDDAANGLDRLTIHEQTVPSTAEEEPVLPAQIEEIEESDKPLPSEATKEGEKGVQEEVEGRGVKVLGGATKEQEEKIKEVHVPSGAPEKGEEEEIEVEEVQGPSGASKEVEEGEIEEGDIQGPSEAPKEVEEEVEEVEGEVEEGEIRMSRLPKGDRPSTSNQPIMKNVEEDSKPVVKTPLFLPSPSPSPLAARSPEDSGQNSAHPLPGSSILDDTSMLNRLPDEAVGRKQHRQQRSSHRREFYILVPSLPSYVRKYKEQEARKKKRQRLLAQEYGGRARSSSEEITSDPRVQSIIRNSVTRIAERRCKWGGCDAILNSSQNLLEHLKRNHSTPNFSKSYILCNWSGCGEHVRNKRIEDHMTSHSFRSFLCPYAHCDESFRSVQALVRHNDAEHASNELKSSPHPFSPPVQEPPPMPTKVPDYLIKSGLVRQEPINQGRHTVFGPWVYNNIAGPVKVTKRYNAAKDKPAEYGFQQSSAVQFSTNPSQPAKVRDLEDLHSGEVSEMISEGLCLWPPPSVVVVSGSEDELDGFRLVNKLAVPIGDKSPVTHQSTSEEDTVETMLTGQPYGS